MGKVFDLGFNLGEVEEFQIPPADIYEAELSKIDEAIGPSGNKYFTLEFVIKDPRVSGEIRLFDNASTSEKARFRLKRILRCLSHAVDGQITSIEEDALKGKRCLVDTFIDTYIDPKDNKEKRRLKIQDYFPLDEKAQRVAAAGAKPSFND